MTNKSDEELHGVWERMKRVCANRNCPGFKYYGAKGVVVCDEWRNDYDAFRAWAIAHGWKTGVCVVRKGNMGDFTPSNCMLVEPDGRYLIPGKWKPVLRDGKTRYPSLTDAAEAVIAEGLSEARKPANVAGGIRSAILRDGTAYGSAWRWA